MAEVEILHEAETAGGWAYRTQVLADDGTLRVHEVSLSWADYNLWSSAGTDEPAAVAIAAIMVLLSECAPPELRDCFDCAIVRRLVPNADALIPSAIRGT